MNAAKERENPWFMNKESSEIMIKCFNLETHEIHDVSSTVKIGKIDHSSLDEITSHILHINRFLYGSEIAKYLVCLIKLIFNLFTAREIGFQ